MIVRARSIVPGDFIVSSISRSRSSIAFPVRVLVVAVEPGRQYVKVFALGRTMLLDLLFFVDDKLQIMRV